MSRGLVHTKGSLNQGGWRALFDTKSLSLGKAGIADELDAVWKRNTIDRANNSQEAKLRISIQHEPVTTNPARLKGDNWIERRKKAAAAFGIDLGKPEEAKKLAAFLSFVDPGSVAVVDREVMARLGSNVLLDYPNATYDFFCQDGEFFVTVQLDTQFYKVTDNGKENIGELGKASYTVKFEPNTASFDLVADVVYAGELAKRMEGKSAIDPSVPIPTRALWFKSQQFSNALENKDHRVFVKEYADFLKQVQQATSPVVAKPSINTSQASSFLVSIAKLLVGKPISLTKKVLSGVYRKLRQPFSSKAKSALSSKGSSGPVIKTTEVYSDRTQMLNAGLESAVIEFSQKANSLIKSGLKLGFAKAISRDSFEGVLNDYCDKFDEAFPDAKCDREAIKQELSSVFINIIDLYKRFYGRSENDSVTIQENFDVLKNQFASYRKIFEPLCDAMRDSLIATIIENNAAVELAQPLHENNAAAELTQSLINANKSDTSSMHRWRSGSLADSQYSSDSGQMSDHDRDSSSSPILKNK